MEMEDEVGSYASFVSRVGRASSELREVGGTRGDSFMMECDTRDGNIVNSSLDESDDDVDMFDETTFIVTPPEPDPYENAEKTTLVIPPEDIQEFFRDTGINSRPRTGIKVKKQNGQFLCPICQHPFKHRKSALHHSYTHMNQLELQKVNIYHKRCPHSPPKIFFTRQHYADHINSHEGIKNFKCQICQKGFFQKRGLHDHMLIHVNQGSLEVQTPFRHLKCYFCHKRFASMSKLISHTTVHTKETPFKCSHCNKWFAQNSSTNYHIRHVHTHRDNPTPFPCPQCPTTCKERRLLNQHIKSVHGDKTHHCSTCSKSFSTKGKLDKHVDGVHRKIRHHCPHCPKTYSSKDNMTKHMKKEHKE